MLNIILCLLVVGVFSDNSFENVTISWHFEYHDFKRINVTSSDNLKETTPENVTHVTVNGFVPTLHQNSIGDFDNLRELTLSGVGLESIIAGAFGKLPKLKYLTLSQNNLKEIQKETFTNLNLWDLRLANNNISTLHPQAFKNLKLDVLDLSYNKISEIGGNVFDNVTLPDLNLKGNLLHQIEPKIFTDLGLEVLKLEHNKFDEINPEVFDIPELKSLELNFNLIKTLGPGDLKNLPQLTRLNLAGNGLEEIHEGVFNATKLVYLYLGYNKIVKIAPRAFDNMSNITVLRINNNNLTKWDNNWLFNSSPQMAHLDAGYNQIEEIPREAFKNCPRLYSIELQGNKIKTISPQGFDKLEQVDSFILKRNLIENWDADLLKDVEVKYLDLRHNKLKGCEGDLRKIFRNIYVELFGNQWRHDCEN